MANKKTQDLETRLKSVPNISKVSKEDDRVISYVKQIKADGFAPITNLSIDTTQHREIMLLVLNDLHIGSPGCNIDKIIRYLEEVKYIPNLYIILNGDLMNNANNSGKSNPLENNLSPMNEQKLIHTIFSDPMIKNKIVCSTSGNHESGARTRDSGLDALVTPMATLDKLDIYARYTAQAVFKIKNPYTRKGYSKLRIFARHGSGLGGSLGKVLDEIEEKAINYGNFDIILGAHTHKNGYKIKDVVSQTNQQPIKRNLYVFNMPAAEEMNSYSTDYGYPPPNTDNFILSIRAERNLDALDRTLNDGTVLPYRYIVDTISLDNPELVNLANFEVKVPDKLTSGYVEDVAERVVRQVGYKAYGRKSTKKKVQPVRIDEDDEKGAE